MSLKLMAPPKTTRGLTRSPATCWGGGFKSTAPLATLVEPRAVFYLEVTSPHGNTNAVTFTTCADS